MLTRTTSARRKVTFVSLVELELFVCEVLEEGIYITGLMSRKIGLLQTRVAKTEAVGGEGQHFQTLQKHQYGECEPESL